MTDQAASARLELLVFSDDAIVRQEVIDGVGRRPAKGQPLVTWTEAATAEGVRMAIKDREKKDQPPFDALVLDAGARIVEVDGDPSVLAWPIGSAARHRKVLASED